jgi:hypothetical protein
MYRVDTVDRVSLFATRDKTKRPSAAVAPAAAAPAAGAAPMVALGIGVEFGGFATHAVALRTGPLTVVQMLVASSLLFSVATVRLWSGRRLSWTAWPWATCCSASRPSSAS